MEGELSGETQGDSEGVVQAEELVREAKEESSGGWRGARGEGCREFKSAGASSDIDTAASQRRKPERQSWV